MRGESKEVEIKEAGKNACFRFTDGWANTTWKNVVGKVADACSEEQALVFNFLNEDPTRNDGFLPNYLNENFSVVVDVTEDTAMKDIFVLSRCDNCMPTWAQRVQCEVACRSPTLAYADKIAPPSTVIDSVALQHYSKRLFCKDEARTLQALHSTAAVTCTATVGEEVKGTQSLSLTSDMVQAGKVCVDFPAEDKIMVAAAATCDSKLRFFFKTVKPAQ